MTITTMPPRAVYLGADFYRARVAQLQEHAGAAGLDGLLVLNPANLMWATGFFHIPNERPIGLYLPAHGAPVLFVPFLEKENAEESWFDDIRWYLEYPGETPAEVWMLAQLPGARIGEVKQAARLPTTRQFERWLTRDAGLTRAEARTVIVKGFGELVRERDAARNTPEGLAGVIRRAAETLSRRI